MGERLDVSASPIADPVLASPPARIDIFADCLNTKALIPELVAAQAHISPNALAVAAHGAPISYQELDSKASRLAHHLLSLGAEPGRLAVICLQPSIASAVNTSYFSHTSVVWMECRFT
jgi:non-ribosomal peptide synthetase component F